MTLNDLQRTKLLGAIEADALVLLCGAGLSVPAPSYLPSAASVAKICHDKWIATEALDPSLEYDVDKLAGHFYARGDFEAVFIPLVPWNELSGAPNKGHVAVADLLISRGAHAALSANFDTMIERWAEQNKVAMQGALTGQEATTFLGTSSPLVKFHGCMQRARPNTLWTQAQLAEPDVKQRIESCSNWMNVHLPGKHLLVVGFWTDWGYLNDVFASAFAIKNAHSVTVVDPEPSAKLQAKAPDLWDKLNKLSNSFEHVQESGDLVLDELRQAYSKAWARKFYALGKPLADAKGIATKATPDSLSCDDLYDLRRDVQGVPRTRAATEKSPPVSSSEAALSHHKLIDAGAKQVGSWLELNGKTIRVVNGAGRGLDQVRGEYREPDTMPQPDYVLCAGAIDLGVPGRLISTGRPGSIVKPLPGGSAKWLTREQVLAEFGL
jgi:hypothetical protein